MGNKTCQTTYDWHRGLLADFSRVAQKECGVECFERALGILPKDWFAISLEPAEGCLEVLNSYSPGIFSLEIFILKMD